MIFYIQYVRIFEDGSFVDVVVGPLVLCLGLLLWHFSLLTPSILLQVDLDILRLFRLLVDVLDVLVLVLSLCLVFELDSAEFSCVFFVIKSHILAEQHQEPKAFDVVRVFLIDGLVDLQGFLEVSNPALAWCHHKLPFDLVWLDLACSFEVETRLLIETLLDIINTKPDVSVEVHREQTIGL